MVAKQILLAAGCAVALPACAQVSQETTLETYFVDNAAHQGFFNYLSWGQTNVRVNNYVKATLSGLSMGGANGFDEACLTVEQGDNVWRVGRIRTAFGLSSWSDLFYNGFNSLPSVRTGALANGLSLNRDDVGLEFTTGGPVLQVQAALIDTNVGPAQLDPKQLDHAAVRLQSNISDLILGADFLTSLKDQTKIYGLEARWTAPRLVVRGEVMAGAGDPDGAWGWYVDAAYRLPHLSRTQLVGRTEAFQSGEYSGYYSASNNASLQTLGLRQVVSPNLAVNLNYCWGGGTAEAYNLVSSNSEYSFTTAKGWSLRTMFQLHF